MTGPRQLSLDLARAPRFDRACFMRSGANAAALALIDAWPRWPDPVLMLIGPEGSGKSHLGHIWAQAARAFVVAAQDVTPAAGLAVAAGRCVLVEDADRGGYDEAALFHLLNLAREHGAFVLVSARAGPDDWGLATPDLVSRLRLAPSVRLGAPDDALMRAVMGKLFADRQLRVEPALLDYLSMRMERSLDAARALAAAIDTEAMARGGAVTRAIAAAALREQEPDLF